MSMKTPAEIRTLQCSSRTYVLWSVYSSTSKLSNCRNGSREERDRFPCTCSMIGWGFAGCARYAFALFVKLWYFVPGTMSRLCVVFVRFRSKCRSFRLFFARFVRFGNFWYDIIPERGTSKPATFGTKSYRKNAQQRHVYEVVLVIAGGYKYTKI